MKKYLKNLAIILAIILLIVTIDLVTKTISQHLLVLGDKIVIPHFFTLTYKENTGAAFSMFSNSTMLLSLFSFVFILLFFVLDYFTKEKGAIYNIAFALIIGGAIGNLVDRLCFKYVRDFIFLHMFTFVFNMADLFITVGIILYATHLLIQMIKEYKLKRTNK